MLTIIRFRLVSVNIHQCSLSNFCSLILRGEYQGLKRKNTDANCSFAYTYAAVVLIVSLHVQ